MGIDINFLDTFCAAAMGEGRQLLEQSGPVRYTSSVLPDGRRVLQAKVIDSFNFVDHPRIELDLTGRQILQFGCDCPDYRRDKSFCAHCAALVLSMETKKISVHATAVEDTASCGEVQPMAEKRMGDTQSHNVMDFSYKFSNSQSGLYPGIRGPKIPMEVYIRAFHPARAIDLWKDQGEWGGNCFGMVSSAAMMHQRNEGTTVQDFLETAAIPVDLKITDYNQQQDLTVLQFIELLQILQVVDCVQECITDNVDIGELLEELAEGVRCFQHGDGLPVMMCVFGLEGGHAVLPYHIEEVSPTEDKLHIYDPNWPEKTRFAFLKKNEQGEYLNWRFPMFGDVEYSDENGGQINMVPYESFKKAWDARFKKGSSNLLRTKPGVALYDETGALVARVMQTGVESYRENVRRVVSIGTKKKGEEKLSVPAGSYTVRLEDPQQNELEAHLIGYDLTVQVVTAAREVVVHVNDDLMIADVQVNQADRNYNITILNTQGEEAERVTLEGITGTENLHLAQREGRLYQRGLTDKATLHVNGTLSALHTIASLEELETSVENERILIMNTTNKSEEDGAQS